MKQRALFISIMSIASIAAVMISFLSFASPLCAQTPRTADEILAASDAVRVPDRPFSVKVLLVEYRDGKEKDKMTLIGYSKEEKNGGQYRSMVRITEPLRDENKLMLKVGNILWFHDPSSKASIRISPQQRLLGQASNGDVVTVNFHKDYKAVLEGEETITDAEKVSRNCYKLNLRATNDSVTYYRIEYWVDKENSHPVKGKYYSESDRLLKIAYPRNYEEQLGRLRPTEIIIIDGVDSKLVTKMTHTDWKYRDIPEEWFQKEYLPRFKGD